MGIVVKLFAGAKRRAGRESIEIELPAPVRIGDLRQALSANCPELAPWLPAMMIAVNCEYASDGQVIPDGAEVAVIPPVSGGAGGNVSRDDRR